MDGKACRPADCEMLARGKVSIGSNMKNLTHTGESGMLLALQQSLPGSYFGGVSLRPWSTEGRTGAKGKDWGGRCEGGSHQQTDNVDAQSSIGIILD